MSAYPQRCNLVINLLVSTISTDTTTRIQSVVKSHGKPGRGEEEEEEEEEVFITSGNWRPRRQGRPARWLQGSRC